MTYPFENLVCVELYGTRRDDLCDLCESITEHYCRRAEYISPTAVVAWLECRDCGLETVVHFSIEVEDEEMDEP